MYWGDYLRDTRDLTPLQHGVYLLMLAHYYSTGAPLPKEAAKLYRLCSAFSEDERAAVDEVVAKFFEETTRGYTQPRAEAEIAKRERIAEQRAEAGRRGASARYGRGNVTQFPDKEGGK